MSQITVTAPNGQTLPIDIEATPLGQGLPSNPLTEHDVLLGTPPASGQPSTQVKVAIKPGLVTSPTPPPPPAPTCIQAPLMEGDNKPGSGIIVAQGKWSSGTPQTQMMRKRPTDAVPLSLGAVNQYTNWGAPYPIADADGGAVFSGREVVTGGVPVISSNAITIVSAGGTTPPPPPPTGTPTPTLPPTWLADNGLSIKSFLGEFHDVGSDYWDCSPTGISVHGSSNGVCNSVRSNAFMRSDGAAIFRTTNNGHSIWATMIPNGLAGNGAGGGAHKGLVLPARCIVETIDEINGGINYDLKGGPDNYHAYDWNGPYTQARSSTSDGRNYAENDQKEFAGWTGADGHATMSYHPGTGITPNPGAITTSPLLPLVDGNAHSTTWVKAGLKGAKAWTFWDKFLLPQQPYTIQDSYEHCMMFSGGYTKTPPIAVLNYVVLALRVWELN